MSPKRKQYARQKGVYERKPGSDVWWIRYVDQYGRMHREKVGPHDVALKLYQKRKADVAEGKFFPETKRVVFVSAALEDYRKRRKAIRSKGDAKRYGEFWEKHLGDKPLRTVTPGDVERAMQELPATLSSQTRKHYLTHLRAVYNVAIAEGNAERVPISKGTWPKLSNERIRYLRDDEEAELRKAMKPGDFDVVLFAIHTGLRQEEQFLLRSDSVDFRAQSIHLPKTKNGKARHVPLNETALAILRRLPRLLHSPWVFNATRRKSGKLPLNARWFTKKVFNPAVVAAKIEDFTWHDLRHTFASRLVMAGVDLSTVQELMGHSSPQMTRRYAHLSPEHKGRAVRVLNGKHEPPAAAKGGSQ